MHIVTQFPRRVVEIEELGIAMSDGTRLSARMWLPEDAEDAPVPAILEYIPYRKRDGTVARDAPMHPYFAGHGYAAIRLDLRGAGDSEGLLGDEYAAQELQDAVEAIAWIAAQPWCDGTVGMMGKSWGGFNCLQVAALRPPALKAVIAVCASTDRFADDIHYKGGCILAENFSWGAQMLSYSSRPPDPAIVGPRWREMWRARLEAQTLWAAEWLRHQRRDGYWKHGSVCEDYSAIEAAVLAVGGWADNYMNTVGELVANLGPRARGIVGPWVHQYPHTAEPAPQIGFLQEAVAWWDRWLKGVPNGADRWPAMRLFRQDSTPPARMIPARRGTWLAEPAWPSPRVAMRRLELSPGGRLGGDGGQIGAVIANRLDVGQGQGRYFPMAATVPQLPGDQRDDDARSLCFDTAPCDGPLDLVGRPVARLRLSADRPLAQIVVRLCEVFPDGASARLSFGMLNLAHRESHEAPAPLTPGAPFDIVLKLDLMAARIAPGNRLRLAISSAYWPFLWPAPERATLTLHTGGIELPVHQAAVETDEWQFDEPEGAEPWAHRVERAGYLTLRRCVDEATGELTVTWEEDGGRRTDLAHGLTTEHTTREVWRTPADDPLGATAEITWTQALGRGDWQVRTVTQSRMWADAQAFHLTGRIEAYEGDTLFLARDLAETVPRDLN